MALAPEEVIQGGLTRWWSMWTGIIENHLPADAGRQKSLIIMVLTYSPYAPPDPETKARHDAAYQTWVESGIRIYPYTGGQTSREIGDPHGFSFIEDMIWAGFNSGPDDVVVICNNDVRIGPNLIQAVEQSCASHGGYWASRIDDSGHSDGGLDLFGLSRWFWCLNSPLYPPLLHGNRFWDVVMRDLMVMAGIPEGERAYYHSPHLNDHRNRIHTPAARYNEHVGESWYKNMALI